MTPSVLWFWSKRAVPTGGFQERHAGWRRPEKRLISIDVSGLYETGIWITVNIRRWWDGWCSTPTRIFFLCRLEDIQDLTTEHWSKSVQSFFIGSLYAWSVQLHLHSPACLTAIHPSFSFWIFLQIDGSKYSSGVAAKNRNSSILQSVPERTPTIAEVVTTRLFWPLL